MPWQGTILLAFELSRCRNTRDDKSKFIGHEHKPKFYGRYRIGEGGDDEEVNHKKAAKLVGINI